MVVKVNIKGTNKSQDGYHHQHERLIPLSKPQQSLPPTSNNLHLASSMAPKPYDEELIIEPPGDDGVVYGNSNST
ncbi:unnamed protein product [Enterobius vermicularis]|uniref:ZM domain-containing protein n=1 Tax=Enterobius vermicularis TaxID=51028 RepID=A0A0N4VLW9_ENTVE|nr:unnamed protein product [Enterobius vermicularis]